MKRMSFGSLRIRPSLLLLSALAFIAGGTGVWAIVASADLPLVAALEGTSDAIGSDQADLLAAADRFDNAFDIGDEIFETTFNAADGVGANVGKGERFTRTPRADLTAAGQWATHQPLRATGPNASACNECHRQIIDEGAVSQGVDLETDDGAGPASENVHRNPTRGGLNTFIQRNTPHLFGA